MADYTLTSSSVLASSSARKTTYTLGSAVAAGQPVYFDAADLDSASRPKAKLADANASATTAAIQGVAASSGASGQPVLIVTEDTDYTHGLAGVLTGDIIILSSTAGGLAPASDMASTMYPAVVMIAISATKARLVLGYGTAPKA